MLEGPPFSAKIGVGVSTAELEATSELVARVCLTDVYPSTILGLSCCCLELSLRAGASPLLVGNLVLRNTSTTSTYDLKPVIWHFATLKLP